MRIYIKQERKAVVSILLLMMIALGVKGQYFGQNKVNYEAFKFKLDQTPHFSIYNYLQNDEVIKQIGNQAEKWYLRHNVVFGDTITENPLILYNNKADFMQTDVIDGQISIGTGGVTEGFKRRVMIPIMPSNRETNHVLGHELVHVFQYYMFQHDDSINLQSIRRLPLWMVEGLAEYMSLGVEHNSTSMWMRDAVIHDDLPTLTQLTTRPDKYFPYRYGHAFWAYVTGIWGDGIIRPLMHEVALLGLPGGIEKVFHMPMDSLSALWRSELKRAYTPYILDTINIVGTELFPASKYGNLNLSPVFSPDGKNLTFLSNKDVISIDVLLADASTGKIKKKLTKTVSKSHIDEFNYIESAGSWSPDGKKYVMSSFSGGKNILLVLDLSKSTVKSKQLPITGVRSFDNPRWSPDGKHIVFNGLEEGMSDLYLYHLETEETERLTADAYSDLQPSWSSDSKKITFISDRGYQTNFSRQIFSAYRLCEYDLEKGTVKVHHELFPNADIYSPMYDSVNHVIYFLSNADGYRNLYRYNMDEKKVFRLTNYNTGISGITELSPAYSLSLLARKIAYSHYNNHGYHIYVADLADFKEEEVGIYLRNAAPETLPPHARKMSVVQHNLHKHPQIDDSLYSRKNYEPHFELEYIGSSGIAVGIGSGYYDTQASGGVFAIFGDELKKHQMFTSLMMQGEIYDIGGSVGYMNKEHRVNWGASISHIPYRFSYYDMNSLFRPMSVYDSISMIQERMFAGRVSLFAQYPFSKKWRLEVVTDVSRYGYRVDTLKYFYSHGYLQRVAKERGEPPEPRWMQKSYLALVGDDVRFGVTSPLDGYRFRMEVDRYFMWVNIYSTLFDYRRYYYHKPFSLGFRLLSYSRFGSDAEKLYPIFLGNSYFIRGYAGNSFSRNVNFNEMTFHPSTIVGSKLGMFNAELRLPFTGPERLSIIKSNYLFSDLVLFFDGGFSAKDYDNINWKWKPKLLTDENRTIANMVYSAGLAVRINLFGYFILEPYIAHPFQRTDRRFVYGIFIKGMDW